MAHQLDIFHQGGRIGVLLIHGLAGTPKEMDSVGIRLHKYGFTVSIPVLAGHCEDTPALLASNRHDWEATAERAYQELASQTDAVFVGGLSAGALLSIQLAHKHPEIRGIALYSTTLKWDGWSIPRKAVLLAPMLRVPWFRDRYRLREGFPYGIKSENLRERIIMRLESGDTSAAGHTDTPGVTLLEMLRMIDRVKKIMPGTKSPALIVHAAEDDMVHVRNAYYIQKHLGGPSELLILNDSYHLVTIDQERQTVAKETARHFWNQLTDPEKELLTQKAKKRLEAVL